MSQAKLFVVDDDEAARAEARLSELAKVLPALKDAT